MKTKKPSSRSQKTKRRIRPLHKRIFLHPISIFLLLCVGVLVVTSTLQSQAASYDITATVPAKPITKPALITSHYNEQHVSNSIISVAGECPEQSYVKLYRDDMLSGVGQCDGTTFHVQTSLVPATNTLVAKVYNTTDNEGPSSPPVTIYYDATTQTAQKPADTPTTLSLAAIGTAEYQSGSVLSTSIQPTVSGYAPPYADITVTFHSDPVTCRTKADANGWWTCTLDRILPAGMHSVDIVAVTPDGKTLSFPPVRILITTAIATMFLQPSLTSPLVVTYNYHYQTHHQGESWSWNLDVGGGTRPYSTAIAWGDGSTSTLSPITETTFSISHTFASAGNYEPIIKVSDVEGKTAIFQLSAVVKALDNAPQSSSLTIFNDIRNYLWIIWPAYITILLMVVSFWLGEYEIVHRFTRSPGRSLRK